MTFIQAPGTGPASNSDAFSFFPFLYTERFDFVWLVSTVFVEMSSTPTIGLTSKYIDIPLSPLAPCTNTGSVHVFSGFVVVSICPVVPSINAQDIYQSSISPLGEDFHPLFLSDNCSLVLSTNILGSVKSGLSGFLEGDFLYMNCI